VDNCTKTHIRDGQVVFDWDPLENLFLTRNQPLGNKDTSAKCQRWVSHVQIQGTIAFASDAQIERKVSVAPNYDCHSIIGKYITTTSRHLSC